VRSWRLDGPLVGPVPVSQKTKAQMTVSQCDSHAAEHRCHSWALLLLLLRRQRWMPAKMKMCSRTRHESARRDWHRRGSSALWRCRPAHDVSQCRRRRRRRRRQRGRMSAGDSAPDSVGRAQDAVHALARRPCTHRQDDSDSAAAPETVARRWQASRLASAVPRDSAEQEGAMMRVLWWLPGDALGSAGQDCGRVAEQQTALWPPQHRSRIAGSSAGVSESCQNHSSDRVWSLNNNNNFVIDCCCYCYCCY